MNSQSEVNEETRDAFLRCELFASLPEKHLQVLAASSKRRQYKRNTVVISKDDETDSVYLVESGTVRVYRDDERGRQVTLNIIYEGEIFGELAALSSEPRIATVETQDDTSVYVIPSTMFLQVISNNPSVVLNLARLLVHRVRSMTIDVSDLALLDVYGRVARLLLKEAREEGGRRVIQGITHQEIANRVGATREMVSRIMKDLRKGEYIAMDGRTIIIQRGLPARW